MNRGMDPEPKSQVFLCGSVTRWLFSHPLPFSFHFGKMQINKKFRLPFPGFRINLFAWSRGLSVFPLPILCKRNRISGRGTACRNSAIRRSNARGTPVSGRLQLEMHVCYHSPAILTEEDHISEPTRNFLGPDRQHGSFLDGLQKSPTGRHRKTHRHQSSTSEAPHGQGSRG